MLARDLRLSDPPDAVRRKLSVVLCQRGLANVFTAEFENSFCFCQSGKLLARVDCSRGSYGFDACSSTYVHAGIVELFDYGIRHGIRGSAVQAYPDSQLRRQSVHRPIGLADQVADVQGQEPGSTYIVEHKVERI